MFLLPFHLQMLFKRVYDTKTETEGFSIKNKIKRLQPQAKLKAIFWKLDKGFFVEHY